MRQIKFRGHALRDSCGQSVDKTVYGDFVQEYDKVDIADWDDGDIYEVAPESVAQLIGIDADGKEIYEGDYVEVVHDGKQYVYQAHLEGFATGSDGTYLTPAQLSTARRI